MCVILDFQIPFYPIVKKDLLFLNEGNDDEVDGLINFEKLRTISKSIRKLGEMCSTKYVRLIIIIIIMEITMSKLLRQQETNL